MAPAYCGHAVIYTCHEYEHELDTNSTDDHSEEDGHIYNVEISILIISCILIVVGLVGNILVVYIVGWHKDMRTVCNILVANFALRDIVFLGIFGIIEAISHGMSIFNSSQVSHVVGNVATYGLTVSMLVTSGFLVALALDRYRSISHPLMSRKKTSVRSTIVAAASIWMVSLLLCIVHPVMATSYRTVAWLIVIICLVIIAYLIPLSAVLGCYVAIYFAVRRAQLVSGESDNLTRWELRRKMRVLRMVAYVVLVFTITWGIWYGVNINIALKNYRRSEIGIVDEIAIDFADVAILIATAINPIIYGVTNANFKRHFGNALCWACAPRTLQHITATSNEVENRSSYRAVPSDKNLIRLSMIELEESEC